jgi:hypothetical protein
MVKHDCDENCHCCGECYMRSGDSVCQRLCEHFDGCKVCQEHDWNCECVVVDPDVFDMAHGLRKETV